MGNLARPGVKEAKPPSLAVWSQDIHILLGESIKKGIQVSKPDPFSFATVLIRVPVDPRKSKG